DHYGADAVAALVRWMRSPAAGAGRGALVTWPLAATLSPQGAVSRAVCRVRADGSLAGTEEHHGVTAESSLDPDAPVSMNLWGLPADTGPALAAAVAAFRAAHADDPDAELPLPTAIDGLLVAGTLAVTTLAAGTTWVGITHADDLGPAQEAMSVLDPVPERGAAAAAAEPRPA
ncbi:MAG TPA: hypothetical protein VF228_11125, partial [Iamia sp.]